MTNERHLVSRNKREGYYMGELRYRGQKGHKRRHIRSHQQYLALKNFKIVLLPPLPEPRYGAPLNFGDLGVPLFRPDGTPQ